MVTGPQLSVATSAETVTFALQAPGSAPVLISPGQVTITGGTVSLTSTLKGAVVESQPDTVSVSVRVNVPEEGPQSTVI